MKRFDVVCLGELLVDFTPYGLSPSGMRLFEQNPGGAPGNVAAALAKLGHSVAFIGKLGDDMNGRFLRQSLIETGVDVSALLTDTYAHTSMAFVSLSPDGERDFTFIRDADTKLHADEIKREMIENSKVFHFGALSMTDAPAYSATLRALELAREAGCIISYDPNYRALLWPDKDEAVMRMRSVLSQVNILKVSEEEAALLTGKVSIEDGGRELLSQGPSCVAVTQGANGVTVFLPSGNVHTPTFPGNVVDTTGAGDAFTGGFLSQCLTLGLHPHNMTLEDARTISLFANAVATCCVARRGGIPAMPERNNVINLLSESERK